MPLLFASNRGAVYRVMRGGGRAMPFQISIGGIDIASGSRSARAIITQAGVVRAGNFQMLHTVGDTIYAYVFGNRIGDLRVGGVAFQMLCGAKDSGIKQVLDAYEKNSIVNRATPVRINFGETVFSGFLVGVSAELTDPESQLGAWTMQFKTFPGRRTK